MKVALVYDRINKWGGAERVLLALHEMFPHAPIYTSVYNPTSAPWAKVFHKIIRSFLQWFPKASSSHEAYAAFMPLAFEGFTFDEYDLVISVTSEAAKGIITKPQTAHICYCLTPTRYLWSGYDEYFKNFLLQFGASPLISYLRQWDKIASNRPDKFIAISSEVQKRIQKYYGKESTIVYPPVRLQSSGYRVKGTGYRKNQIFWPKPYTLYPVPYFLVVSRLVPYKRIDLAVQACNDLHLQLKIIGTGSKERYLKQLAGSTIEFLGNLTDAELVGYYEQCTALIFPGKEDFGITIVEAQQFGKPVIAYKGGGALETIIDGKTGILFAPQSRQALKQVLKTFQSSHFDPNACRRQAEKFSFEQFKKNLFKAIKQQG